MTPEFGLNILYLVVAHLMLFSSRADYSSVRTVADRSRASPHSLKTTVSFSQSVPTVGAKCRSSAPHGWSVRSACLPVGVDPPGRPSLVALPKVAVEQPLPVTFGNTLPKLPTSLFAPVANRVSYHLARTPTQSQPNPAFAPLFEDK